MKFVSNFVKESLCKAKKKNKKRKKNKEKLKKNDEKLFIKKYLESKIQRNHQKFEKTGSKN